MAKLMGGLTCGISAVGFACQVLAQGGTPQQTFAERVDVARILIDVRVVDDFGRPVLGLTANEFEVEIDDKPARVESAEWVGGGGDSSVPLQSTELSRVVDTAPRGRSIVFLVQKSLEPSRAMGLLRWPQVNEPLLRGLTPDDRVAVLSFDSHLRTWLDFTRDIDRVRAVMAREVIFREPGRVEPGPEPSLLARLSQDRARKMYTIEEALLALGHALEPLPGSKSIVLVGYGFGRMPGFLMPDYDKARDALQAARVSLLCLDVTFADYHTLEIGLQTVAADTGGIFARLYQNPSQAVDRVVNALEGHYVLFAEKPDAKPGLHRIAVRLPRAKGTVLARSRYME
jgi:VWFA-related protein